MMKNKDILLVLSIMLIFAFSVLAVAVDSIIITDFAGAEKLRNSPINYGASFRMNVTCSSCADNVTVLINSTSDGTGITVILNVTNAGEGIFRTIMNKSVDETLSVYHAFTNHINLSTSGSYNGTSGDANYSIKVSDNAHKIETITVYFNFSNPGSVVSDTIIMQQTGVAYWFNSGTGVGYYNSTYTDDDDTGSVIWNYFNMGVNDSGRDLNPSVIDNVTINVTTSSGANIQMCLNESGVSTGIFNVQTPCAHYSEDPADYPFNLNSISSDSQNKLKVVSGDNLNLTYIADVDFDGSTVDASDKIWMDTLGEISDPGNNINPNSTASTLVQIYDNGTNTDYETVQSNIGFATLYSYTVNWELIDTVTVGLNESVADSSALDFNATIYANTGITSETWADTSTLHVASQEGGFINVTYNDSSNFSGEYIGNANTIGPIQIDIFDTGVLSFNYSGSAIGTGFSFLFKVNDSDINTDSTVEQASVIISSTRCIAVADSSETGGGFATFFLNESNEAGDTTETDSAVFGIPVGRTDTTTSSKKALTFTFAGNTTHSCFSNDTHIGINATANDKIYVNYSDQFPTADYQLTSWMEETGTTTITNGAGASSSTFNATDYVYFNISDAGRNTNNATIQCVTVVVNSTSDTDGITIGINETGADTGIFANDTVISCSSRTRMPLQLSTSSAEATNKLLVAAGSTVQVMYDDNRNAAGANPAVNVSSTFNVQSTGTISIDASRYHINNDVVVITVTDKDNKTQTNITGVSFSSNMNHTGIYITLNRTDSTNGVFNVTVDKTSEVGRSIVLNQSNMSATGCLTGDYHINVSTAGWVMANYTDASTGNIISTGKIRLASDATPLTINATATAFIPANTVGINITVTDMANNTDVTAQDTIDIMVNTTTNSTTRFIQATETTADSGIFELILDTSTSAQDADTVLVSSSNIEEYIKFWYLTTLNSTGTTSFSFNDNEAGSGDAPNERMVAYYTASAPTLDLDAYNVTSTSSTANFTIVDYDANIDDDILETITVYFTSDFNTSQRSFTATETGSNTGIFINSSITFNNGTGILGDNDVRVREGDTFAMWYQDTESDGSSTANRTSYAVINVKAIISGGNAGGEGWDLISVPMTLSNTAVSSAMGGVTYNTIYWYNDTSDEWETPTTMEPLKGYAVQVNSTQNAYFAPITSTLDTSRTMPTPTSRTLSTGWNMIGINNLSAGTAGIALASLESTTAASTPTWSYIYDWTGLQYTTADGVVDSTKSLGITVGYWIHIRADATNRDISACGSGR